ncbi:LOB domain-containing protein 22-like [Cornus florida]|uniref:LOB domain-containing protein 22-like n=1 Tax=Cornus florida TaxID=4283 RepID=UPI0028A28403|nr:LOB domain-containing protein 22-like [Cornus florida]
MNEDATVMYQGACAACKHQRKRCDINCPLAPYFPASKHEEFQNVHRLFGVNNMLRILDSVPDDLKDTTAATLIFEAQMRRDYPVKGSGTIEAKIRTMIDDAEKELFLVKKQLAYWKETTKMLDQKEQLETVVNQSSLAHLPPHLEQNNDVSVLFPHSQHQIGTPFDAGYYQQPLTALGPRNETTFDYQSNLEEGAEIKALDAQPMDEMMGSYQHGYGLGDSAEPGGSRYEFRDRGKLQLAVISDEDEAMEDGR